MEISTNYCCINFDILPDTDAGTFPIAAWSNFMSLALRSGGSSEFAFIRIPTKAFNSFSPIPAAKSRFVVHSPIYVLSSTALIPVMKFLIKSTFSCLSFHAFPF